LPLHISQKAFFCTKSLFFHEVFQMFDPCILVLCRIS
jgi:hypothetical protein